MMMASRGMGAVMPSKMHKKKIIHRKDDPNKVELYNRGGKVKKLASGDLVEDVQVTPNYLSFQPGRQSAGANIKGRIPLSEQSDLNLAADLSASKERGRGLRGGMDTITAELKHRLDKDKTLGAAITRDASGRKSYRLGYNQTFAKGGEVWDKARPKDLGKPKKLSPEDKAKAKASAKRAGRPYPNLVDNMRAARSK